MAEMAQEHKTAERHLTDGELRAALEELRDTLDDVRAEELKRLIANTICGG